MIHEEGAHGGGWRGGFTMSQEWITTSQGRAKQSGAGAQTSACYII